MTSQDILMLQKQLLPQTVEALSKSLLKAILPEEVIINAKRVIWHLKSKKSSKAIK